MKFTRAIVLTWVSLGSAGGAPATSPGGSAVAASAAPIAFNDNRIPAGRLAGGALSVDLVAQPGMWRPYGADSQGVAIPVFGEVGKPLQDPGPLLRVRRGTRLNVSVHNLTGSTLVVHGFSARRVTAMDTLVISPGATAHASFVADAEGTYYYWASTHGEGFEDRVTDDAHLNGALIVDPPAGSRPDRVFVVEWYTPDLDSAGAPDFNHILFSINGRPWPFTERLTYDVGDSVRWRIINASADVHPFHMHGFFYRVDARGDFKHDTIYWPDQRRHVVTEPMWDGTTMDMAWRPDRPGGWIFHCHFNFHVIPNAALPPDTEPSPQRARHLLMGYPGMSMTNHAETGMGGLVLGIYIRPPAGWRPYTGARRTLRLLVESDSAPGDSTPGYRYALDEAGHRTISNSPRPFGPPIILHRGEPTRIWVVNHTAEMTQVHWHGLEIESNFDGVVGISGEPGAMEPGIMPGDSYAVNVTPPRAGSYMYHTHVNDIHQQTNGLYGPLIVLDSGETWQPDRDRVFIVGDGANVKPVLNGGGTDQPLVLQTDTPYRFRLMNLTVVNPALYFQLVSGGALAHWTPIAKDAWPTPPWQRDSVAARQNVNIGETFDFRVERADTGTERLELRGGNDHLIATQVLRFVKH